jgi:hypothetical protein
MTPAYAKPFGTDCAHVGTVVIGVGIERRPAVNDPIVLGLGVTTIVGLVLMVGNFV